MAEQLPVCGYVARIKSAELKESRVHSQYLFITLDIAEGNWSGWYQKDYERRKGGRYEARYRGTYRLFFPLNNGTKQDQWTVDSYHKQITALEKSNPGYTWDPRNPGALAGKLIGIVVREAEWNGYIFTQVGKLIPVDAVRNGQYELMPLKKDKDAIKQSAPVISAQQQEIPSGFTAVETPSDLPF